MTTASSITSYVRGQIDAAAGLGAQPLVARYTRAGLSRGAALAAAETVTTAAAGAVIVAEATLEARDAVRAMHAGVTMEIGVLQSVVADVGRTLDKIETLLSNPAATASAEACREGYNAWAGRDLKIAELYFDRAIEHRPNDVLGCYGRGLVADASGEQKRAFVMFAQAARAATYSATEDDGLRQIGALAFILAGRVAQTSPEIPGSGMGELADAVESALERSPESQYLIAQYSADPVRPLALAIYRAPEYTIDAMTQFDPESVARAVNYTLERVHVDDSTRAGVANTTRQITSDIAELCDRLDIPSQFGGDPRPTARNPAAAYAAWLQRAQDLSEDLGRLRAAVQRKREQALSDHEAIDGGPLPDIGLGSRGELIFMGVASIGLGALGFSISGLVLGIVFFVVGGVVSASISGHLNMREMHGTNDLKKARQDKARKLSVPDHERVAQKERALDALASEIDALHQRLGSLLAPRRLEPTIGSSATIAGSAIRGADGRS